jgi:hypothetical protein
VLGRALIEKIFNLRKLGPLKQSKIQPCGGQSLMALPVKIARCFGVLEE